MKHYFLFLTIGALTLLGSCKTQGCTYPSADNYDAAAEEPDGTWSYSIELVFYLNADRATYYDNKPDFYAPFHLFIGDRLFDRLVLAVAKSYW